MLKIAYLYPKYDENARKIKDKNFRK